MKKDYSWDKFLKINLISIATLAVGVIASILQTLNFLSSEKISRTDWAILAILILLILLATSELVDKAKKLDRLEALLTDGFDKTLQALGGATINKYRLLHEGWDYVALRIRSAESNIDHAGLAPPTSRWSNEANNYLAAVHEVLISNRLRYRYIAGLAEGHERLDRVRERLNNPEIKEYRPAYYLQPPGTCTSFSFMIFDRKEVVVYYPKDGEEDEIMISIKQPDLVEMYLDYFQCLWTKAQKLTLERARLLEQRTNRSNVSA